MFVLGITGPSGAGKGTASRILEDLGFYHIDTDRLVPGLYPKALPALVRAFGPEVAENGQINKKALAKAAFSSPDSTEKLNSIIHPLVMQEVTELIRWAAQNGYNAATVDGAALHEAHAEEVCDKIICILADKDERLNRVMKRDSIPVETANLRFQAQKNDDYYAKKSDAVIVNGTIDQLHRDLFAIIKEWKL